jgi:hypothetical protein
MICEHCFDRNKRVLQGGVLCYDCKRAYLSTTQSKKERGLL